MINVIKINNKSIKILVGLAFFTIVVILLLSLNSFYNGGDDYSNMCDIKQRGIINNCIYNFFNWDGRALTIGSLMQYFSLRYLPVELIVFIWSLCFLTSGFLIYYILTFEINFSLLTKEKRLLIALTLPIVFWLGSYKHISETVYWATGGAYSFSLLLGAIWVLGYLHLEKVNSKLISKIGFIICSLIVSATTQNLSIALITLVVLSLIINYLENKKSKNIFNYWILLALVIGFLFITLAPGSFIRIHEANKGAEPGFNIFFTTIRDYLRILLKFYSLFSMVLYFLSMLTAVFIAFLINPVLKIKLNFALLKLKTKHDWVQLLINTKWLWVAFSTILPFLAIPGVASSPRTSIFFMFFMTIFIIATTLKIVQKMSVSNNQIQTVVKRLFYQNIIFTTFLCSCLIFVTYNFNKGMQLKNAVVQRETILKKSKNKKAYVKLIDPNLNTFYLKLTDYVNTGGPELPEWIIESQERYYGTKIIVSK